MLTKQKKEFVFYLDTIFLSYGDSFRDRHLSENQYINIFETVNDTEQRSLAMVEGLCYVTKVNRMFAYVVQ